MKPIGYIDGSLLHGTFTDYHYTLYMDSVAHTSAQWIISNRVTIKETIRRNIQQ